MDIILERANGLEDIAEIGGNKMTNHTDYDMEIVSRNSDPKVKKAYREYKRTKPGTDERKIAKERLDTAVDDWIDEPRFDIMETGHTFSADHDFEERRKAQLLEKGYNSAENRRSPSSHSHDQDLLFFPKGDYGLLCPRGQEFVPSYVRKDGIRVEGYCRDLPEPNYPYINEKRRK